MNDAVLLALLLGCSAVTAGTAIGWLLAAVLAVVVRRTPASPATRAALLAQARLMPLACVAIVLPTQIHAFARYEAGGVESAGPLVIATALLGILLTAHAMWSGAKAWRDTARVVAAWRATAMPLVIARWPRAAWTIRPVFPIVAVVGVFRPQLFVASQVIRHCSPDELAAIAAHEAAHVTARDNVVRLLFRLTPGSGVFRRLAAALERAWEAAAEQAADALATAEISPVELASALTKVARLASSASAAHLTASTLIGGADLHSRIRRLLEGAPAPSRHPLAWLPGLVLLLVACILQAAPIAAGIHELFEALVRRG